ncbi:hypothetical protein [Serratia marcescens]|uniref:hypothetical protein n=1 Tax=Serratia marcescens TaxID=615 RepID=UPI001249F4B4|nr:hypothetical protein [Serratia marcescens]KAB1581156.1 hypothetical protein F7687_07945 [Serratia marcescens]
MNLHRVVRGAITAVNPDIEAVIRRSDGTTTGPGRTLIPKYLPDEPVTLQLQPLSGSELRHAEGLNMQGVFKSVHISGSSFSVLRGRKLGGDLLFIDGEEWLVIQPLELWPEWCRLLVCLQVPT